MSNNPNNPHGLGITYEELVKTDLKIEPEAFANEVIRYCKQFLSTNLTNLKLQKLLY